MSQGRVSRSWGMTIFWVVAALSCGVGAAGTAWWAWNGDALADFVGWPATVLLGIGSLISSIGIFTASSTAKCPSCAASISAFDPGQPMVLCEGCHAHARVDGGALHAIAPDYVHPTPIFTAALGPQVAWCGCVACGEPSSRTVELELKESQLAKNAAVSAAGIALFAVAGAGFVQTGGGKVWRVPVPYCDRHQSGVALDTDFGTPVIRFGSHAPYRAFLAANRLTPVQPATV